VISSCDARSVQFQHPKSASFPVGIPTILKWHGTSREDPGHENAFSWGSHNPMSRTGLWYANNELVTGANLNQPTYNWQPGSHIAVVIPWSQAVNAPCRADRRWRPCFVRPFRHRGAALNTPHNPPTCSIVTGVPPNGWYIVENPMKVDGEQGPRRQQAGPWAQALTTMVTTREKHPLSVASQTYILCFQYNVVPPR